MSATARTFGPPPNELADASSGAAAQGQSAGLSISRNFSWTLVGNVCFAGCQWANLVVLAKLGGPVAVGRFALGLAVTAPLFLFANLQLRSVQATDACRSYCFGHYLGLRLLTTSAAMAGVVVLLSFGGFSAGVSTVVLLIALGKCCDAVTDVVGGLAQQLERLDRIAWSRMLAGIGSLGGLTLGVLATGDIAWGAGGWALGYGLTTLLSRYWMGAEVLRTAFDDAVLDSSALSDPPASPWRALWPSFDVAVMWSLLKVSLPLGFVAMLISLNSNAPRYFIEDQLGEAPLGIFAGMAYLVFTATLVCLALGDAAMPRLSRYLAAGDLAAFNRVVRQLLLLAAFGGALTVLAAYAVGPSVLRIIYTPEFAQFPLVLVCLAAVGGIEFASSFLGVAVTAARRFLIQVPLFVCVALVTIISCYFLIPSLGLLGAALAVGMGGLCRLFGSAFILWLALRERRALAA